MSLATILTLALPFRAFADVVDDPPIRVVGDSTTTVIVVILLVALVTGTTVLVRAFMKRKRDK
jgi:hypothetical protein